MRIIAGEFRGRRLTPPRDASVTRPITDRVKTALFDRLWSLGALPGEAEAGDEPNRAATVVDIFCGTGSLGLEALSRGAGHCTFVEQNREALTRLRRNIDALGVAERAAVLAVDALAAGWVGRLKVAPTLIFLDPPYRMLDESVTRRRLAALMDRLSGAAADDAVLVLRAAEKSEPLKSGPWSEPASYTYGSMTLHFYEITR